jgi:polyferredoxin
MFIGFALALLVGPAFCGWVCPLGSFQEWIGKLGKKINRKKFNQFVPARIDKWMRYLRYAVLIWVLYITAVSAQLVFADYDPYYALFQFWTGEVALSALIILGVVIVLGLFIERPFCKYACPYGAVLGIFNLFRIFKIRRNINTCINCKACDRACPMNIEVSNGKTVRNHQCISCLKCTSEYSCPVSDTVEMKAGKAS